MERLAPALGLTHGLGGPYMKHVSGPVDTRCTLAGYRALGTAVGLSLASVDDVTPAVLPTFPVLRRTFAPGSPSAAFFRAGLWGLEAAVRLGLLRYCILTFRQLEA